MAYEMIPVWTCDEVLLGANHRKCGKQSREPLDVCDRCGCHICPRHTKMLGEFPMCRTCKDALDRALVASKAS